MVIPKDLFEVYGEKNLCCIYSMFIHDTSYCFCMVAKNNIDLYVVLHYNVIYYDSTDDN